MIHRFSKGNIYLIGIYTAHDHSKIERISDLFFRRFHVFGKRNRGDFEFSTFYTTQNDVFKLYKIYKKPRNWKDPGAGKWEMIFRKT